MERNANELFIINANIVQPDRLVDSGYIRIQKDKIVEVGKMGKCLEVPEDARFYDCRGKTVIPGMIDIHVHGAGGSDFMDATPEAFDRIAGVLAKEGTTSYLATTMTNPAEGIKEALICANSYLKNHNRQGLPEMIGVHLEGPFINEAQKGAQPKSAIMLPDALLFKEWQKLSGDAIKIVTFAPELDEDDRLLNELRRQNIIASIGHSNATYEEAISAMDNGVSHATHLFNGMRGMHHRELGVVGAALLHGGMYVEIIPDGNHFHPDLTKMAVKMKGIEQILVITDGMRAKGLPDGHYDLGGNDVTVKDGICLLTEGSSLAGSIVSMNDARMNFGKWTGLAIGDQVQVTSVNQAKRLGIFDRKGSIEVGKDADVVVLGVDGEVELTLCKGVAAYIRCNSAMQ